MNWEAIEVIGGSALVLFLVIAPMAVWWHRRKVDSNQPKEASLTGTGLAVMSGMVLALLAGAILNAALLTGFSGSGRAIIMLAYLLGVSFVAALIGNALERRGYPFSRSASGNMPPNKSLERSREP